MKPNIQFRLLGDKAPVTATYPAQTQSNEQNTRKNSSNTATKQGENGWNY